jgi:hypothetical protein
MDTAPMDTAPHQRRHRSPRASAFARIFALLAMAACSKASTVAAPADVATADADAGVDSGDVATDAQASQDTVAPSDSVTATDASADAPDVVPANDATAADAPWYPSWKDEHGCEAYEYYLDGKCITANPTQKAAEKACWEVGQVNDFGVGRPCKPGEKPCDGIQASCCDVDLKHYGAVCTMPCDGGCGAGSWCLKWKNICLPAACQALFEGFYAQNKYTGSGFDCPGGSVGASGIGTSCTAGGKQCQGLPAGECLGDPIYLKKAGSSSFCTHDCTSQADCGAGATCVYSNGPPYFCVPSTCAGAFATLVFDTDPDLLTKIDPCGQP